ncbi:hypothetical protein ACFWHR_04070 [Leucobacter sp. NPDC058333]|uniref:hypothetical protein n=1 Tax=Leucobacter sp. NPDC058333 TaxID=3346450 RepID=UPI0036577970
MDWTRPTWRALCLLVAMSAALPFTPFWFLLGPVWQGVAAGLVLIFALVILIARYADSDGSPASLESE